MSDNVRCFTERVMLSGYKGQPSVDCVVQIEIDIGSIAVHLGEKAYRNKSKRSGEIGGRVKVKVTPAA